MSITEAKGSTP